MSRNQVEDMMSLNMRKSSNSIEIQEPIIYTIPTDPIAWARAVPTRRHAMWDSQKQLKLYLGLFITKCHGDRPFYQGPLQLNATFFMPMNQKMLKYADKYENSWYDQRPDFDNLIKLIADTCNGILYEDDKTICASNIKKVYSANPRTEFTIIQLTQ